MQLRFLKSWILVNQERYYLGTVMHNQVCPLKNDLEFAGTHRIEGAEIMCVIIVCFEIHCH